MPFNSSLFLSLLWPATIGQGRHPITPFYTKPLSNSLIAPPLQNQILYKLSFTILFSFFTSPSQSLTPNHLKAFTISFSSYHNSWIWIASHFVGGIAKDLVGDVDDKRSFKTRRTSSYPFQVSIFTHQD